MPTDEDLIAQMRAANATRVAQRRAEFLAWKEAHPEDYALQVESAVTRAALPPTEQARLWPTDPAEPPHLRGIRQEREKKLRADVEKADRRRAVATWRATPEGQARLAAAGPRGLDRTRRALELRAAGMSYAAIGEAIGSLQHPGPIGPERVRQIVGRGERMLRHPSRAAQWAEYESTGTFTPWW
jgi:hypothetical protein